MPSPDHDRRRVLLAGASLAALGGACAATTADVLPDGEVSPEVIAHAEKLAGISFTKKERTSIAATIAEQLQLFAARIDAGEMPNSLSPATVFHAMPAGHRLDRASPTGDPLRLPDPSTVPRRPNADRAIALSPLTHLATWFKRGEITSQKLTTIYLERIKRHNPTLKCVITTTATHALEQAARADREHAEGIDRGPLHGMPYGAKDIIDTAGIATTWGAAPFKDRVATKNAFVIDRLDEAGAVLIAKTSLGALAYGDQWFGGTTKNPWNTTQGSSGSSAGSSSGTAAGLYAFSLGTETYGSIVSPCMRCGTTGLRPTFGRVARSGVMSLCYSLDKLGPICRTVGDTALVLAAIHGRDAADPSSVSEPFNYDPARTCEGLRVGWHPSWFAGATHAERKVLQHLKDAGCDLVEVDLPALPYSTLLIPLFAEAAASFESLTRSNRDDDLTWQAPEAWPNTFRKSWFIPAVELVQADRVRRQVMNGMADIFDSVDALAAPSFAANLLLITNSTGHPALVQPIAVEGGQPHGFTLIGRLFDEGTICRLGQALESAFNVVTTHPEAR